MLLSTKIAILGAQAALAAPAAPNILAARATSVTVNVGTTYQTMDGFGFSQAFGRANDLYDLPSTQRSQALDLLFSPTAGAGMTILRNRIGSGGSGDSIEPTGPSSSSGKPTYVWDGSESNQVWLSQQAQKYGVTTFYADAWSAPGFMKTNNNQNNGGYLCGVTGETCSSGDWKQAYANFIVQYIKDYASVGVPITYVGFLNEPDLTTSYSSMRSDGQQAADFIKVLYPALQSAGLSSVGITCCDAEGWNDQRTMTADLISAGVESMIARITSHSYTSSPTSPINTKRPVWETEYADLDGAFSTTWYSNGALGEGLTWANLIYTGIVNANLSAYLYWEGIEDGTTNSCLIAISGSSTVTPSSRLWAFAHFSRYARPGAVRIGTSGAPTSTLVAAFKNTDGTVSVMMINNGASSQDISLSTAGYSASSVHAYITNQSNLSIASMSATISGGVVSASIPGRSLVTFVLSGTGGSVSTSTGTSTSTRVSTTTTSTGPSGCTASQYAQCGGSTYTGCTTCVSGTTCTYSNAYYSQCL